MPRFPSRESINRRTFLTGALAVAGAAATGSALSGCQAKSSSKSGSKTVTVMYKSSEFTKDHIAAFEKLNPKLTIEFIEFDETRLTTMLAAGNPPDLVRGPADVSRILKGQIAKIDQYLDASTVIKKSDLMSINDNYRWDGKKSGAGSYYGLVKDWSPDATLWQNTALFQKAGVTPLSTTEPISWDDLLPIAKQLTVTQNGKITQHGLGLEWAWSVSSPMFLMIAQQGAALFNDDLTQVNFTSSAAQRAVQWYADFARAGVGPTSLNPLPDGSDQSTFAAGKMAITMDGYWFGGNYQKSDAAFQESLRMVPAPTFGTRMNRSFSGGIGAWIPAKAKNKDGGWKVMEYFLGGDPAVERAKSGWGMPGLQSMVQYLPQKFTYQVEALKVAQEESKHIPVARTSPYIAATAWTTVLDAQLQEIIKGKTSVADACGRVEEQLNKLLKQGKEQFG